MENAAEWKKKEEREERKILKREDEKWEWAFGCVAFAGVAEI